MTSRHLWPALLWACNLCLSPPLATASDDGPPDHEQARLAVERGEVLPLKQLMERLERQRPGGQILEVELERGHRGRGNGWVYEIKQMEAGGQIVKIRLDARTGEVLEARSGRHRHGKPASQPPPGTVQPIGSPHARTAG